MGADSHCESCFSKLPCFLSFMCCGNDDAELWSAALLESVIIPSGQSVWHSAVTFQSPPSSPLVRHSSLPPYTGEGWVLRANMFLPVLSSFVLFQRDNNPTIPTTESKLKCLRIPARSHCVCLKDRDAFLSFLVPFQCKVHHFHCRERKPLNSLSVSASNVSSYPEGYYYTVTSCANKGCEQVNTHLVGLWWKNEFGSVWESNNKPFIRSVFFHSPLKLFSLHSLSLSFPKP